MTPEQLKEFGEKYGADAKIEMQTMVDTAKKEINDAAAEKLKGYLSEKDFQEKQQEALKGINEKLADLEKLDEAVKMQGKKLNGVLERGTPNSKTIEQFVQEQLKAHSELREGGKYIEFSGSELKAAGVYSIAGTIDPASPYAPGIGGRDLDIFDIARNPNFITGRVDLGRTNQSILAWANEIRMEGAPAQVLEGATKPQVQHVFEIETSKAKKIAGWIELTEEFEQDLPYFATQVRRMLNDDVFRAFDDAVQVDIQNAARPYEITQLNGTIQDANLWDAALAMTGQVGYYNYIANTIAINALTNVKMKTLKNANGTYLLPPFVDEINDRLVQANKMAVDYALVGDLSQYKVDIYKDFYLKIGWINDQLIQNKFSIVGEMRYHSYISDARTNALVYDNLNTVAALIGGTTT